MSIISSWREPFVQTVHNQQREEAIAFKKTPEEKYELNRRFQKTENLYRNLVKEIDLRLDTKIADDVYQFANERLKELQKEPSTQIRRSFYEGRVSLIFRDLDNTMAMKLGRPLHRYCGCNVLERDAETQPKMNSPALIGRSSRYHVPYPIDLRIDQKLNQKSAVIYSWSYGGGHDSVQSALAQRYAAAGMHVYNVQFDDELIDCDPIWNLTGHRYSTRDLIGYLMTNNWWKTIRLINWHFSGTPKPAEEEQRIKSFASVLLTRGLPDIALSCVARYVGSMEKAGARLGIPFCNVSSDLDPLLFDLQNGADVENSHFVHGIVARDAHLEPRITLPNKMVADIGLSVRPAILNKYSANEIRAIREQWTIAEDRRVVIVLAGRDGIKNSCAEEIIKEYKGDIKIHLLIVCGNNKDEWNRLNNKFSSVEHTTVLGLMDEKAMGEMYAVASDPTRRGVLVSAKGGGGTIMEAIASGVPLLVSDLNGLHWEKENINFVERNQLGVTFKGHHEIADKLSKLLDAPYVNPFASEDSVGKSIHVVRTLIEAMEKDPIFKFVRKATST